MALFRTPEYILILVDVLINYKASMGLYVCLFVLTNFQGAPFFLDSRVVGPESSGSGQTLNRQSPGI